MILGVDATVLIQFYVPEILSDKAERRLLKEKTGTWTRLRGDYVIWLGSSK